MPLNKENKRLKDVWGEMSVKRNLVFYYLNIKNLLKIRQSVDFEEEWTTVLFAGAHFCTRLLGRQAKGECGALIMSR